MKNTGSTLILLIAMAAMFPSKVTAQLNNSLDTLLIDGMTETQCRRAISMAKITTYTGLGFCLGGGIMAVLAAREVNSTPDTGLLNFFSRATGQAAVAIGGVAAVAGLIAIFVGDNNRIKYSGKLLKFGPKLSISPALLYNSDGYSPGFSLVLKLPLTR